MNNYTDKDFYNIASTQFPYTNQLQGARDLIPRNFLNIEGCSDYDRLQASFNDPTVVPMQYLYELAVNKKKRIESILFWIAFTITISFLGFGVVKIAGMI